jgi:hypothetical protein
VTRWDELAQLVAKFKIEDSEPKPDDPFSNGGLMDLAITLDHAETACWLASRPENDANLADDLDEVARLLECAADLLDDAVKPEHQVNSYRLWRELEPVPSGTGDDVCDKAVADLRRLAAAARNAHRQRGRGHSRDSSLAAAVKILMDYWVSLGREFKVGEWIDGEPKSIGAVFVRDAMKIIAPHHRLRGLQPTMRLLSGNRGSNRPITDK